MARSRAEIESAKRAKFMRERQKRADRALTNGRTDGFDDLVNDYSQIANSSRDFDSSNFGHGGSDYGGCTYD